VSDLVADLAGEVERLYRRVRGWTQPSWRMSARAATPSVSRADRMVVLLAELAELGRAAGTGAPPGAVPERVGEHALPDQLVVLANDLIEALADPPDRYPPGPSASVAAGASGRTDPTPERRAAIVARARAAIRAAGADLVP